MRPLYIVLSLSLSLSLSRAMIGEIMVGSAGGEMLMPLVIGQAFDRVGPQTFPIIMAAVSISGAAIFLVLLREAAAMARSTPRSSSDR